MPIKQGTRVENGAFTSPSAVFLMRRAMPRWQSAQLGVFLFCPQGVAPLFASGQATPPESTTAAGQQCPIADMQNHE